MIDDITLTQTEKEVYWNRFHEMGELIERGDVFEKVARAFFTGFALACELRPTEPSLPRKMVKEINQPRCVERPWAVSSRCVKPHGFEHWIVELDFGSEEGATEWAINRAKELQDKGILYEFIVSRAHHHVEAQEGLGVQTTFVVPIKRGD